MNTSPAKTTTQPNTLSKSIVIENHPVVVEDNTTQQVEGIINLYIFDVWLKG